MYCDGRNNLFVYDKYNFVRLSNQFQNNGIFISSLLCCCCCLLAYFADWLCCKDAVGFVVFQLGHHYFELNLLMFIATTSSWPVEKRNSDSAAVLLEEIWNINIGVESDSSCVFLIYSIYFWRQKTVVTIINILNTSNSFLLWKQTGFDIHAYWSSFTDFIPVRWFS